MERVLETASLPPFVIERESFRGHILVVMQFQQHTCCFATVSHLQRLCGFVVLPSWLKKKTAHAVRLQRGVAELISFNRLAAVGAA